MPAPLTCRSGEDRYPHTWTQGDYIYYCRGLGGHQAPYLEEPSMTTRTEYALRIDAPTSSVTQHFYIPIPIGISKAEMDVMRAAAGSTGLIVKRTITSWEPAE